MSFLTLRMCLAGVPLYSFIDTAVLLHSECFESVCSYTAAMESKWRFSACWGHLQEGAEVLLLDTRKAVPVGWVSQYLASCVVGF